MYLRNMDSKINFTSTEVIKILGISQRRLTLLVDKALVVPIRNAEGAGSKRLYSYLNLLELSLAEKLFEMKLGIHLVKEILQELREEGILELWSENFKKHFEKLALHYSKGSFGEHKEAILNKLMPKTQVGILFYIYEKNNSKMIIIPWDFEFSWGVPFLQQEIFYSEGAIIVNLGEIKKKLDDSIKNKKK